MPKLATIAAAALSLIAMLGLLASIGFGPDQRQWTALIGDQDTPVDAVGRVARQTQWEATTTLAPPTTISRLVRVEKGDSLMALLRRVGVSAGEAQQAIDALKGDYDPRRDLQIGQTLSLAFAANRAQGLTFDGLVLPVAYDTEVAVRRSEDGFAAHQVARRIERRLESVAGEINDSVYRAGIDAGMPPQLLANLIRIYSYDVDFQRGIHPGDRFEFLYERVYDDAGEPIHTGDVKYAKLTLSGRELPLFRYETTKGTVDYFTAKGESVRKALLRTPIDGARISSSFGRRRHPILGYTKLHTGTDFAAPSGTPIFAAGDGVIESIGRNGGYGNYIRIRHNGSYKSAYGHMKGFARGLGSGNRVRQGQIIGYVGTTGRSTGPHLHYEIHRDGKKVNPVALKLPSGEKLAGDELARFAAYRDSVAQQFAALGADAQTPTMLACAENTPAAANATC